MDYLIHMEDGSELYHSSGPWKSHKYIRKVIHNGKVFYQYAKDTIDKKVTGASAKKAMDESYAKAREAKRIAKKYTPPRQLEDFARKIARLRGIDIDIEREKANTESRKNMDMYRDAQRSYNQSLNAKSKKFIENIKRRATTIPRAVRSESVYERKLEDIRRGNQQRRSTRRERIGRRRRGVQGAGRKRKVQKYWA